MYSSPGIIDWPSRALQPNCDRLISFPCVKLRDEAFTALHAFENFNLMLAGNLWRLSSDGLTREYEISYSPDW